MTKHDAMCRYYGGVTSMSNEGCSDCSFIFNIRHDERMKLKNDGWVPPEQHKAIVATTKVRVQLYERETIAQAIESQVVHPATGIIAIPLAAQIARNGG